MTEGGSVFHHCNFGRALGNFYKLNSARVTVM